MQFVINEILLQLSLREAQEKFHFIHVYSEPPLDEYEADLQAGKIKYPLGLTLINAKEINEDKIAELILEAACQKSNPVNLMVSNLSIFYNQEICISPSEIAVELTMNTDSIECKEFQPAGPGYGF